MSNFETPVKDSESPPPEESSIHMETSQPEVKPPTANAAPPDEPQQRPVMPPTFVPGGPPRYTWPNYSPGVRPQWAPGSQLAPPYKRRNSAWPWIIVSFVLLFILLIGGVFIRKLQSNIEKYDDWITRNITMEVLGNFALHDEALRAYLVPKLEELVKDRRISVSKRALKILQYLESTNSV